MAYSLPKISKSPFQISGPIHFAFSGGRTSAFMLKAFLDAHGGTFPKDCFVTFQNTGREMPETLDFIAECASRWKVKIHWLEYAPEHPDGFIEVGHNSAARDGEPFEKLIVKKGYLPNVVARFCTAELKVRVAKKFMMKQGISHWTNLLGLRADELKRVLRSEKDKSQRWRNHCPLARTGTTRRHISAFWKAQPFNLMLLDNEGRTPLGNCDGCMMKSEKSRAALVRDYPDRAAWWQRMEKSISTSKGKLATFDKNQSWAQLSIFINRQGDWIFKNENTFCDHVHGGCTD